MQPEIPSRTALRVALRRAAHQLFDAKPLIFEDPAAIRILGSHAEELQRTPGRDPGNKPRPHSIALRAHLVVRSRYAEDLLARAVADGVKQYVVLGAGLDTFAHRNPYPQLRIFEVDHPDTQNWKQELLQKTGLGHPSELTYIATDFEQAALPDQLQATGFNVAEPAFFAWLGVVPYLTLAAFRATVRWIASQAPGSGLVFDYAQPRAALPPLEQLAFDSLASRVQLAGEAFQLFFTPKQIAVELAEFYDLEDLGTPELNERYCNDRTDKLRLLGSAGRIVSGWL